MTRNQLQNPPLILSSKDYTKMTDDELRAEAEAGDIHARALWAGVEAYNRKRREIWEAEGKDT